MASRTDAHPPTDDPHKAAPGDLDHVRLFVNTRDLEDETDAIAEPATLQQWLAAHDLIDPGAELGPADVRQARDLREALRKMLLANNGDPLDPAAVDAICDAARRAELQVRVDEQGHAQLVPVRSGVEGAVGRLLAIVFRAQAEGTWARLKACALHDTCEWAFYDSSKNRSGTWCDMAVCGNRAKARAYRERRRGQQA
jgi:predicted RNA-binding Zn ribbon-like protein